MNHFDSATGTSVDRYRDGMYERDNPTWHEEDSGWKAAQVARLMRESGLAPHSICDVGCGSGHVLGHLRDLLAEDVALIGYDVSEIAIKRAIDAHPASEHPNVSFRVGSPPPDEHFDIVMALDVVEHIEDCWAFLRGLRPVGRHLLLHIPLEMSVTSVARPSSLRRARDTVGHIHQFSFETALSVVEEAGFTIEQTRYTASAIELSPNSIKRSVARIPRRIASSVSPSLAARFLGGFSLLILASPVDDGLQEAEHGAPA
jgi:ubiquinone/menaquinone biosynthesis C-methylase UbiE